MEEDVDANEDFSKKTKKHFNPYKVEHWQNNRDHTESSV